MFLYCLWKKVCPFGQLTLILIPLTQFLALALILGRRYALGVDEKDGEVRLFTRAMQQFMFLLGAFEFSDVIPFIEWMDLQGHVRSMKQIAKVMDSFMSRWLEEHIQSRENGLVKEEHDFMDVLLSLFPGDGVAYGHSYRNIIKGTALVHFYSCTSGYFQIYLYSQPIEGIRKW